MDIQHLVDNLEQALNESTRVPLSAYLIVNEEKVYSLLDQMRVAVPEEIKRANRIEAEKDRLLAQAKDKTHKGEFVILIEGLVNKPTVQQNDDEDVDLLNG